MQSNFDKATDAAAGPLGRRIHHRCGNHRGHNLGRILFGVLPCLVALLLTATPRPSSANVLTRFKAVGGVAPVAGGGGQPFELLLPKEQFNQGDAEVGVNLNRDATFRGNAFKFDVDGSIDDEEGNSGLDANVEDVTGTGTDVSGEEGDAIAGGTYGDGTIGKAMPTKAKGVNLLLSIRDVLKSAQVFEHVPNKLTEKDDGSDGFVVVRGHKGATEAAWENDRVISISEHVAVESDAEATSSLDTLALLGVMLITFLLLVSSVSPMSSSSNPSLYYKTISAKKKTSKLGAWKVLVIALFVSCCLVPLGIADDTEKVLEVDRRVEQIKLRGAVAAEAHADIGGYEEQDEVGADLVSDSDKEKNKENELLDKSIQQASIKALEVGEGGLTYGTGSCTHTSSSSCLDAGRGGTADIGDGSCTLYRSCLRAGIDGIATIGDGSCTSDDSCSSAGAWGSANIGDNSCTEEESCRDAGKDNGARLTIDANACTGTRSCKGAGYSNGIITIGSLSCNATESCMTAAMSGILTIGMSSCTGFRSCYSAGEYSYDGVDSSTVITIGNGACTVDQGCEYLDGDMPAGCPSSQARDDGQCDGDVGDYCYVRTDCNQDSPQEGLACVEGVCVTCSGQAGCPCSAGNTCNSNICDSGDGTCTCMAGKTGLTKVEKVLGSVISSEVVEVRNLEVGDRVVGLDENMAAADECEVVSVASTGNKAVFGNYTSDHYILNGDTTDLTVHGEQGADANTEDVFQVLTSCPVVTDETGNQATFTICGRDLYGLGPMPWSTYLKIHMTMFNLVKTSGIRDLSAFNDLAYANEHLPGLCASGLACADDAGDCTAFEQQMLDFINRELTPAAREKALAAFPNLGDASKMGSVSYLVSKGKSAAVIKSIE